MDSSNAALALVAAKSHVACGRPRASVRGFCCAGLYARTRSSKKQNGRLPREEAARYWCRDQVLVPDRRSIFDRPRRLAVILGLLLVFDLVTPTFALGFSATLCFTTTCFTRLSWRGGQPGPSSCEADLPVQPSGWRAGVVGLGVEVGVDVGVRRRSSRDGMRSS